jgi:hypothetical protein
MAIRENAKKLYSIKLDSLGRGNMLLILMIFSSVVLFLYLNG